MRILDKRKTKIVSSNSPLAFETTGGGAWEVWDRFISVKGMKVYHIGNVCGTCSFFFENISSTTDSIYPKETIDKLNTGLSTIDSNSLDILRDIIPNGFYEIALLSIRPNITSPGDKNDYFNHEQVDLWGIDGYTGVPHSPKTDYYRGNDIDLDDRKRLYEFFIPLTSPQILNPQRVEFYKNQILNGNKPTAISLSVIDMKGPAMYPRDGITPNYTSHCCLAHYIIDGHHKIRAASDLNAEITLLAYIATEKGVASEEDIKSVLNKITGQ